MAVISFGAIPVARANGNPSPDPAPDASTRSVRIPADLVVMLKLIEAAADARGERFNTPAYLGGKLRRVIVEDYRKAKAYFAEEK